jgi:hypothetical protein
MLKNLLRYTLPLVILLMSHTASAQPKPSHTFLQKSRTFHTSAEFERTAGSSVKLVRSTRLMRRGGVLVGGKNGVVERTASGTLSPFPYGQLLPVNDITVIAEERPGILWFGSKRGAIRYDEASKGIQYFAGLRWLPDDPSQWNWILARRRDQCDLGGDGKGLQQDTLQSRRRLRKRQRSLKIAFASVICVTV